MAIRYHIEKLNTLLEGLAGVLHVSILILDKDGEQLSCIYDPCDYCSSLQTISGIRHKCQECDKRIVTRCKESKKIEKHHCHAGLLDLAMPIIKDNMVVAYIVLGRIRTALSPDAPRYENTPDDIRERYQNVPYFSDQQLQHLTQLLPEIVLNGAITVEYEEFDADIVPYITAHLHEAISVPFLCKRYHVSKNTLYRYFRERHNCSIGEYIVTARIRRAKELLTQTNYTVTTIAEQIGVDNYTYFCKLFKQKTGQTPTAYRASHNKTGESL